MRYRIVLADGAVVWEGSTKTEARAVRLGVRGPARIERRVRGQWRAVL